MENTSDVRSRLAEIVSKADSDPGFYARLRANPSAVLKEHGIPENAVEALSRANSERRGTAVGLAEDHTDCIHTNGCRDFTCWSSACPNTCYVSYVSAPPDA